METPLFFKNRQYNLFGVLHIPDEDGITTLNRGNGIVFCHPFAEEKLISHKVIVNLARRLARQGIYCFRFDYMGHGDSDGDFENSTIETRLSDIKCAADFFKDFVGIEKIGLLGVRFGATLSALSCEKNTAFNPIILISPIIEGNAYIEKCLRSNLTTQMTTYKKIIKNRKQLIDELMAGQPVNIDGYLISKDLYSQISAINLLTQQLHCPSDVLVLTVASRKNQAVDDKVNMLFQKYQNAGSRSDLVSVRVDPFWKDSKIYSSQAVSFQEAVAQWLAKLLTGEHPERHTGGGLPGNSHIKEKNS
jgi:exosortase A-associated hydrolase 2